VVQIYQREWDGHRGHSFNYREADPFDEVDFDTPEGKFTDVRICKSCIEKGEDYIKKLRLDRVVNKLSRVNRQVKGDKNKIKSLKKRIKHNEGAHELLNEYLELLKNDEEIPFNWDGINIKDDW